MLSPSALELICQATKKSLPGTPVGRTCELSLQAIIPPASRPARRKSRNRVRGVMEDLLSEEFGRATPCKADTSAPNLDGENCRGWTKPARFPGLAGQTKRG